MADLLGRRLLVDTRGDVPPSLQKYAEEAGLPQSDVAMLAAIEFGGERPRTTERYCYIYNAIRTSSDLDRYPG